MNPALRRTIWTLRIILAIVFINYGLVKVLGGQYFHGDWTITKSTVDGNSLIWAFFGYSPLYGRLTGLFELLPGIFILWPRTAWVSAAALFAVSLNVTLMDFLFHFHGGAKDGALVYTILALVLVLLDYEKLRLVLASPREVQIASTALRAAPTVAAPAKPAWFRRPGWIAVAVIVIVFAVLDANFIFMALHSQGMPEAKARAALQERGLNSSATFTHARMHPGVAGFNSTSQLYFTIQTPNGLRYVRVNEVSPSGFAGWRVVSVTDMPTSATPQP